MHMFMFASMLTALYTYSSVAFRHERLVCKGAMSSRSEQEERAEQEEEQLKPGNVWKWYAYCPLGGSCSKGGATLGGFFSEARSKQAVLNHLVGSTYHGLSDELAEFEATAVEAVIKMQVKDNALSDGDGNRSQRSDGDRSRRSQRDTSHRRDTSGEGNKSHKSHKSVKSKRRPRPPSDGREQVSLSRASRPITPSPPVPRRKKQRALPSTAEQARAQSSRAQLANAETEIEMQIRVQAKQAVFCLQRPCPIKNQPN